MKKILIFAAISIFIIAAVIAGKLILSNNDKKSSDIDYKPNTSSKVAAPQTNALTYDLPFTGKTIRITRTADGKTENTFWGSNIATVNVNGDVTPLYNREDQGVSLFFDTPKNGFYRLYPQGYEKLSIVSSSYIRGIATKNENIKDEMTNTSSITACKDETITLGSLKQVRKVACTNTVINNETREQTDQSTITTCYLPIEQTTDYLAYELALAPAGTTANLCDTLKQISIQSVIQLANN